MYQIIKIPVRLALGIFSSRISAKGTSYSARGPMMIIANHPNSFLDAIMIGSRFSQPVHFLARGDAFVKPHHRRILSWLNMIPVYRLSEGKDKLHLNEYAFERSKDILHAGGILLVFIEGICVNSHTMQPFRKGAARIAEACRHLSGFSILPLGIAYSGLHGLGHTINIHTAAPIPATTLLPYEEPSRNRNYFNQQMREELEMLVQIPQPAHIAGATKTLLFLPAMLGLVVHAIPYLLLKSQIKKATRGTVFFNSVLFAALLVSYPLLLLLISVLLHLWSAPLIYIVLSWVLLPFSAWCAVRIWK